MADKLAWTMSKVGPVQVEEDGSVTISGVETLRGEVEIRLPAFEASWLMAALRDLNLTCK